jgi:hypothetical protein
MHDLSRTLKLCAARRQFDRNLGRLGRHSRTPEAEEQQTAQEQAGAAGKRRA